MAAGYHDAGQLQWRNCEKSSVEPRRPLHRVSKAGRDVLDARGRGGQAATPDSEHDGEEVSVSFLVHARWQAAGILRRGISSRRRLDGPDLERRDRPAGWDARTFSANAIRRTPAGFRS